MNNNNLKYLNGISEYNKYFQKKLSAVFDDTIDEMINNARKEARDDLDQFEKEIELIEQGYSAEEVLNMTKKSK